MRYRHLRRTVIAVLATTAFVLLIGLAIRAVLEAGPVRHAAKRWIEAIASRSEARVAVGDLHWGLFPPTVRLEDVRLESSTVTAEVDVLQVELARVRVTTRIVELGTVAARGVNLRLEGAPGPNAAGEPKFDLRIRHLELAGVELEGVDLPGGLTVELGGLRAGWTRDAGRSRGYLDIAEGHLTTRQGNAVGAALSARYTLSDDGLRIDRYRLEGRGFDLTGEGNVTKARQQLRASGSLDIDWLDGFIRTKGLLAGRATVDAVLDTAAPELLQGAIDAESIRVAGFSMRSVTGSMGFDGRGVRGTLERALFRGGTLTGDYRLASIRGRFPHRARLRGTGVSLAGFLDDIRVESAGLAADVDADVEARWNGRRIGDGTGTADVRLRPAPDGIGVAGQLKVGLEGDGLLRFDGPALEIGSSSARWQGGLALGTWEPAWAIDAQPAALDEVATLVNRWVGATVLPPELAGTGHLQVTLSGSFSDLVASVRAEATPLVLPPITIDRLVADALISGSNLEVRSARFQIGDGFGEVDGRLGWGEADGDDIDLGLRGRLIPLASPASWIGLDQLIDRGNITFTGRLGGPITSPHGRWSIDLEDLVVGGVDLGGATATVELADGRFTCRDLRCQRGLAGVVAWDLGERVVAGTATWPGMPLPPFAAALSPLVGDSGDVTVDFRIPADGRPTGRLTATSQDGFIDSTLAADEIGIDAGIDGAFRVRSQLAAAPAGAYHGRGELRLESAGALLEHLAPDSGVPLEGEGHATFDVTWTGGATLPRITGNLHALDLALDARPVRLVEQAAFAFSSDGFTVPALRLRALDDELFLRCDIDDEGSLRGNLAGTFDSLLLRFLLPEWEPAGRATGIVELLGTVDTPELEGIAEIRDGSFRLPGTRTILSQVDGTILLSSRELQLDSMAFRLMGGRARCNGSVRLADDGVVLALTGTASGVRYEPLPDLDARLSGTWGLIGPVGDLGLSGDLTLDRMALSTKKDLPALMLRWLENRGSQPSQGGIDLSLHVEADETIDLRSPFIRVTGSGAIDITGTTTRPGLIGQIDALEGGEATVLGNRFEIDRGGISFSNPATIEPFLDLQVSTFVQEYQVTLQLSGTFDRIVATAASTPPLSAPDIYSLLGVGSPGSALGSSAMGLGLASSILSSELTSVFRRRGEMVLPVDQVRFDPFAADSTGNPTARLSVIKQLTPSWTVILQSTLDGEREQLVVSRWYIAPGLFIEAAQNRDESLSLDLKLRRPY